jgi:serine/threonine protein kinase
MSSSFSPLALRAAHTISSDDHDVNVHVHAAPPGGFASITALAVSNQADHDILDFIFFVENHSVRLFITSEFSRDDGSKRRRGTSMQVDTGLWQGKEVAIKTLRRPVMIQELRANNPPEYKRLLELHKTRQRDMLFEIKIMARKYFMAHRNIVTLYGLFFEDKDEFPDELNVFAPGMVLELADERFPDLEAYLESENRPRPIAYDTAAGLISDIADGISALHSYGVIHADIKPANILIFPVDGQNVSIIAKIADFGFCGIMTSDEKVRGGTYYWHAPELLVTEERPARNAYMTDPMSFYRDIYAFGLVAITIYLDGQRPFSVEQSYSLKTNDRVVEHVTQVLANWDGTSRYTLSQTSSMRHIVQSTLCKRLSERLSDLTTVRRLLLPR